MKHSNFRPPYSPFIYGLLTCIVALLIRQVILTDEMRYTSNWTSFLLLLILLVGAYVYFRQVKTALLGVRQIFESSLLFGLAAGLAVGLWYYIDVTIIDADYLQKALDASHKSWADKGYSNDAIAGQEELTETFQNPLKWSLIITLSYFMVTTGFSFIIGCTSRKVNPSTVDTDTVKHA